MYISKVLNPNQVELEFTLSNLLLIYTLKVLWLVAG